MKKTFYFLSVLMGFSMSVWGFNTVSSDNPLIQGNDGHDKIFYGKMVISPQIYAQPELDSVDGVLEVMADWIPTAGATETFEPAVGDFFFDPGGPGGGPDGSPGNYPDCNCDTQTTLSGVSEIKIIDMDIFANFDYLRIYDGTDSSGTLLYGNGAGDPDDGDYGLPSGTILNATSGSFFFFFHATTVVNRLGWEIEIMAADGGGGGGTFPDPYCEVSGHSSVEPITLVVFSDINNPSDVDSTIPHEDFTSIVGNVEVGETYNIGVEGYTGGNWTNRVAVWIDWNQDGVFDETDERYDIPDPLVNSTGTDGQQINMDIEVPADALTGETRMRVMKKFSSLPNDSCTSGSSFGQTEDYTINVTGGGSGGGYSDCITTIYASNNGGGANWGQFFDVTVKGNDLSINSIDINTSADGDVVNLEVYVIEGDTYAGNELNAAAWGAPVSTGSGIGMGDNNPTEITLNSSIDLDANENYAFAIFFDASPRYTNGDATNRHFENDDLELDLGASTSGAFSGSVFADRIFNGSLCYDVDGGGGGGDCTDPTLSVDEPDAVCEGSSVTFTATSDGDEIRWYDSETSTAAIHTGSSFTTPDLSATTSYWVQAFSFGSGGSGETITGGARVAPTSTTNSSVVAGTSPWGLSFDADVDFTIDAVDVYLAGAAGTLVMELLDENWVVLDTKTVATPAGNSGSPVQHEVELGFEVEAGNTYRLVASSSPDMVREFSSSHDGFPYPIGDAGTVTGGTINNSHTNDTVYYFFYNWTVTKGGDSACTSDRLEVTAEVTPAPAAPEGDADQYFTLGQTLADLVVDATGDLTWYEDNAGTTELPETTELVDGTTYYVSQTIDGCESELFAITVHLIMGVSDMDNTVIAVYPNPVTDFLNISAKSEVTQIEIFDTSGRRVSAVKNLNNNQIDFRNFAEGTYIIRLMVGKEIKTVKVIKK